MSVDDVRDLQPLPEACDRERIWLTPAIGAPAGRGHRIGTSHANLVESGTTMAVIKTIDLVGVSTESWRDAAHKALDEASKTLRGIEGFDVLETSAMVADNHISEYHTHVRIRFRLDR